MREGGRLKYAEERERKVRSLKKIKEENSETFCYENNNLQYVTYHCILLIE